MLNSYLQHAWVKLATPCAMYSGIRLMVPHLLQNKLRGGDQFEQETTKLNNKLRNVTPRVTVSAPKMTAMQKRRVTMVTPWQRKTTTSSPDKEKENSVLELNT